MLIIPCKTSYSDYQFKILLIGDSSSGKSSLLSRYIDSTFESNFQTTIGIDFVLIKKKIKTIELNHRSITLKIWDTAGQERFKSLTTSYFRGAQGVIIVFDLTEIESFKNVRKWFKDTQSFACEDIKVILVGNKSDLVEQRKVEYEEIQRLANELGLTYCEASAKSFEGVENVFTTMASEIKAGIKEYSRPSTETSEIQRCDAYKYRQGKRSGQCW